MKNRKPIKEMTREERNQYNKERYEARTSSSLTITINNCPADLKQAILSAIAQEAK